MNESGTKQIIYEFARAASLEGWWVWAILIGALAVLLYACVRLYRRDTAEVPAVIRWTLIMLRVAAIIALVFFFFDLQRRTQRLVTRPSEVAILVDTSQSMSLPAGSVASKQSRAERAAEILGDTDLLEKLAVEHRVSVYSFAEDAEPNLLESRGGEVASDPNEANESVASTASPWAWGGAVLIGIAILLSIASLLMGASGKGSAVGGPILGAAVAIIVGIICLGSVYAVRSQESLSQILGAAPSTESTEDDEDQSEKEPESIRVTNWADQIVAAGAQSRIGDAIKNVLTDHDPATLAGIVLLTDGQSNGGSDATSAMTFARRSQVAVFPVGMGSSDAPVNVRVVDLDAPRRVYPGDKFAISGVLQASGPKAVEVEVQLMDALDSDAKPATNADGEPIPFKGEVIDSQRVKIENDGTLTPIRFELEPESVGRRRLAIRVVAPKDDRNKRDDIRDARYEVVARKLRVLAIAGGPTREYRFARNLLYRDKSIELDVWLQSGQPGMSQDADNMLTEFPGSADELFEYDAIMAFDADWLSLTVADLDMVDRWLAQQAGGMIIVAGPVYHPRWTRTRTDPRVGRISGFFPVTFSSRGPLLGGGRQGGENAWAIEFSPEARRA